MRALQNAVTAVADSVTAAQPVHISASDSVLVTSPLPSGIASVVRFLLNAIPPWVQIGGAVLGAIIGLFICTRLWANRQLILATFAGLTGGARVALALLAVALVGIAGAAGAASWNYTQHSNDFCTGCHVMNPAFQRFSTTENKHSKLTCHACHQQSMVANVRQLYFWVAERPDRIKPHSKVPNAVCENCHVTADTAKWHRIRETAGHRVHLESDSLKKLQCVTCHGLEVHRFRPVDKTCGQANCHKAKSTEIVLGKMATQTVRHCTGCHPFTATVPNLATRDSARGTLVPGRTECLGCHDMRAVLKDFDAGKDPHGGKCGTCHNPHKQKDVKAAAETCANAGCHDNWKNTPFHVGKAHRKVGEECTTCHRPHASRVDASSCEECHVDVRKRSLKRPPLPFDTTAALRRSADDNGFGDAAPISQGGPSAEEPGEPTVEALPPTPARRQPPVARTDSFPHGRHANKIACLVCHGTGDNHGSLTFERPRGCAICHHQSPSADRCPVCHRPERYGTPKTVTVTVTVPGKAPRLRTVGFLHDKHTKRACTECHTTPVTMAPGPTKITCQDCHTEHHGENRACATCHQLADPKLAHTSIERTHQACDACHTPKSVAKLTPTRTLCSTCHPTKAKGHYDARECSSCHFLAAPDVYRQKLSAPPV